MGCSCNQHDDGRNLLFDHWRCHWIEEDSPQILGETPSPETVTAYACDIARMIVTINRVADVRGAAIMDKERRGARFERSKCFPDQSSRLRESGTVKDLRNWYKDEARRGVP